MPNTHVLVSGASFAGLTTAYWMNQLGYQVTVVEVAVGLRKGGTPVDITGETIGIVKRMGLFDQVRAHSLPPRPTEFLNTDGEVLARMPAEPAADDADLPRYEVPRDELLRILFESISNDVEVIFSDSVTSLTDTTDGVRAVFRSGTEREFALVFGCDGNHSLTRRLRFGDESRFSHFLGHYFAISIVDHLIIDENTTMIYNVPGRTVMLTSYENTTDITFSFHSETEIPYDYRNQDQQRRILADRFTDTGWRAPALMKELQAADNFYFDKLCQIKMPRWYDGRVVLVGDAAYCASPAAGMGGSLAIIGATVLADALAEHRSDVNAALEAYDHNLRPFVDQVQADVISFGLATFFPETQEQIDVRNQALLETADR